MKVDFLASSSKDPDATWASSSRLINWYREPVGDKIVLKSVLGTQALATLPGVFCRAMAVIEGLFYIVHGGGLWRVASTGDATLLGAIDDSEQTSISGNNGKVTIVANGKYYVWDGETLSQPEAGAFSDFGSVSFIGQLTVLTERNGRRVQWSAVADPSTLDGLDFATTESRDDDNLRSLPIAGGLWIFKQQSIERWYQEGTEIRALPGGTIDKGLKAFNLLTPLPDGCFFIGTDNKAYLVRGGQLERASTVPVETSISKENPARVFFYEDEGHEFCVITYPNRPAWVWDIATGEWHERAEGDNLGPWTAAAAVGALGAFYICDNLGNVLLLTRNNMDATGPLVRRAVSATFGSGERFKVNSLQINGRVGSPATVVLRMSRDKGETWGQPRYKSLGAVGEYRTRPIFRGLGQFFDATIELTISDPVDVGLDSAAFVA